MSVPRGQLPNTSQQHQDLVNAVISVLGTPEQPTTVASVFSNERNLATEVQAYAKIAGRDWTFYVKHLVVTIGRNTDPDDQSVDIDLGPAKVVSRKHATIKYNLNDGFWELQVQGRNGAKVNFHRVPAGPQTEPVQLQSGSILDIGGTQMMFILPDQGPYVDPGALDHLTPKLNAAYGSTTTNPFLQDLLKGVSQPKNAVKAFRMYNSYDNPSVAPSAPSYAGPQMGASYGTIMDPGFPSSNDIASDLSRDENKNVKPPYSYATMITQAILSNPEGVLSLADIYKYISTNYAYYRYAKTGWQNSIRHNLSLNKAFEKVPRKPNEPGKGMKWRISEDYQKDFLEKWHSGKVSKVRRGSSVARQLQLHMTKFNSLPIQGNSGNNVSHSPTRQSPLYQKQEQPQQYAHDTHTQQQQQQQQQQHQHQHQHQHQQQHQHQHQPPALSQYSTLRPPPPTLPPASSLSPLTQQRPNSPLQMQPPLSIPIRQPPIQQQVPHASFPRPGTRTSQGTLTSIPSSASRLSPGQDSLLRSPTKPFHITPMEAYTPERGSSQVNKSPVNNVIPQIQESKPVRQGSLTAQSSPGVWNLLQFSSVNNTPAAFRNIEDGNQGDQNINGHSRPISQEQGNTRTLQIKTKSNDDKAKGNVSNSDFVSSPIKSHSRDDTGGVKELMLDTESAKISVIDHN